jgi:hypothetical protein
MELTRSFVPLLKNFVSVFTAPTYITFVAVVTGWILSHRHRYITEVIFSSGNVGNGHWCRFHPLACAPFLGPALMRVR